MVNGTIEDQSCSAFSNLDEPGEPVLMRFVVGDDAAPHVMSNDDINRELGDPFAQLLLAKGTFPSTAEELLAAIDAATGDGDPLRAQRSFMLGEDGQLGLQAGDIDSTNRSIRFVVARGSANHGPELVISASHPQQGLVEVMAWDDVHQGFNFYRTLGEAGAWAWAGNSRHALQEPTRGKGPFESHPSGNLIMKELKFPWLHWDSFKAHISLDVFPTVDVRRDHRWLRELSGAQICETAVVMPSIVRWTNTRFEQISNGSTQLDAVRLIEHVVTSPTVNLITSSTESAAAALGSPVDLPPSFFVDVDGLAAVGLPQPRAVSVPSDFYVSSLGAFAFRLTDGAFAQPGDTHFAFVVPERAFEDNEVLRQAVARSVLSRRLVATLLMVDFPNPVFSSKRAQMLEHVPNSLDSGASDLSEAIANAIIAASPGTPEGSPEQDFARRWTLGEEGWEAAFSAELFAYYSAIEARVATQEGFNDYVRLAESRRNEVRRMPIGKEFRLLFPETDLPREQRLEMRSDATVAEAAS